MRKVKFTQQNFHDKITQILTDFPVLDDIHPFYADLINVLYDKDHYKLALGQLNTARHLIDNLGKDYVRLLKFGDSLYRCKCLKRAALGRMCTIMKKQNASLAYLEQVRQHLSRLPSIDPNTRTVIICGYPNVGKSSFLNTVTRADVDVQPYAFTTKSIFVGHTYHKHLRYQILDTPGILDHPLEERNTIEMLSITALAHLRSAVLFMIDISEQCGYSIEQQVALFESIKPLFAGKPLVVGINKTDVISLENLREDAKELLTKMETEGVKLLPLSTLTNVGVSELKEYACEKLLSLRVDQKVATMKRDDLLSRLHVAVPVARDNKERPPHIPESVFEKRANPGNNMDEELTSNVVELEQIDWWKQGETNPDWDPTVFGPDWRNQFDLKHDEWKFDDIPEVYEGSNIADFIDPDIMVKLRQLEEEEEIRLEEEEVKRAQEDDFKLSKEEIKAIRELRHERTLARFNHRMKRDKNKAAITRKTSIQSNEDLGDFENHLLQLGIDPSAASERIKKTARARSKSREARSLSRGGERSKSHARSKTPAEQGLKDNRTLLAVEAMRRRAQKKPNSLGGKGEADRHIPDLKPKHLYSGKRGIGKNDRR